jgi:hypothetical protein
MFIRNIALALLIAINPVTANATDEPDYHCYHRCEQERTACGDSPQCDAQYRACCLTCN